MYKILKISLIFLCFIILPIACTTQSKTKGIYTISWVGQPTGTVTTPGDCALLRTSVSFEWAVANTNNVGATLTSYTYELLGADNSIVWSYTGDVQWIIEANGNGTTTETSPLICYQPSTIIIKATIKDKNGYTNSYQLGPTAIAW